MSAPLIVHCDARVSSAGAARLGWVISDGLAILSHGTESPPGSWDNNAAEMLAVLSGARALAEEVANRFGSVEAVAVVSDSTAVVSLLNRLRGDLSSRDWRRRNPLTGGNLFACADAVLALCKALPCCRFVWVPREDNRAADWLTREPCAARWPLPIPPPLPDSPAAVAEVRLRARGLPRTSKAPAANRPGRGTLSPARCGWSSARASGLVTLGEALGIKAEEGGEEP